MHISDLENEPHVNWSLVKTSSPVQGVSALHGMVNLQETEVYASA